MRKRLIFLLAISLTSLGSVQTAMAQANIPIYTDYLVNGFQDWSWATRNMANSSPVHSGTNSISVTGPAGGGIAFHQSDFNTSPYASFSFWANGGASGGQRLQVYAQYGASGTGPTFLLPTALTASMWTQYIIPLSSLGVANISNLNRLTIQIAGGSSLATFYLDDIQLTAASAPATVHLNVDITKTNRLADGRWFGINTATWDGQLSSGSTLSLLQQNGCQALRWPGGSTSDTYHWSTDLGNNGVFRNLATNLGAQVFITVNYGSGGSNEAAAWVKWANITNHAAFKFWEIGNECYGTWETDTNAAAHDPWTYAVRAAGYIAMMKAADPTIKIGVVGAPGEDSYVNNTSHPVVNPRTGLTHNGWTPVMLATLHSLGVTPDFFVHHVYPEYTAPGTPPPVADSDPLLLQAASNWANDAADLRQQITDYMGSSGANIELTCTENNSDSSSAMGKQLTSIVNGLYLADSTCRLMKTEFNAYLWWDLRNGHNSTGTFDPTIYGWRTYGDEGMLDGASGKYPIFYAEKLLQYFVRPGDTVLNATSDYLLLASYAARKTNGTLTMLVINKDATTNFNAQIAISNFIPASAATVRFYGIPQDDAVFTNNLTAGAQDIATNSFGTASTNFTYNFPPLSLTLFTFTPVTSLTTTVALSSGANPSTYGNTVTFTATVKTNGVAVGGISGETINFYAAAVALGSGTLNGSGQASYTTTATQISATSHSITARYGGDSTYNGSTNSPALAQNVNQATLTAGLTGTVSKPYNGTTTATLAAGNYTLPGVLGGDTVTLNNPTSGTYDSRNVGSGKTVTVTGLAISGTSATNYVLSSTSASGPVGTIGQINIGLTAAANIRFYDATIIAAATPTVTSGSVQPGDTAGFVETYDTQNAGVGKLLTPSGIVNDANGGNNYSYSFNSAAVGTINQVTLTYTANTASMTYGSTLPGVSGTVTGFVTGENQANATTGTLTFITTATSSSNAGGYPINGTGLTANNGNYQFAQAPGNATAFTINKLPVNLTGTRPFDGTTTAAAAILSVANKIGSDDVLVSSGSGTLASPDVGLQTISSFGSLALGGTTAGNYTLSGASGSVNITFDGIPLTVTNLLGLDKVYDGTTNATLDATNAGLDGVQNGDDVTLVTNGMLGYFADKNVGTNKPIAVSGLALGGAAATNYVLVEPTNVTASITPAGLTISGVAASTKVYDGTTVDPLSGVPVLNGQVNTDDVSLVTNSVTALFADPSVGTGKPVTVSGYALTGADAGNYNLTQPTGFMADILSLTTPVFVGQGIAAGAGGRQLSFSAQSGQTYKVLATSDLRQPISQWTVLTNGIFSSGTVTFTDSSTGLPARFYLIVSP
jgi:hypothetical protein